MNQTKSVGLFGKLPAHGDFIYRDLPSNFINAWDSWLQGFVGASQEQIGESWLDIYLTSPIWRFAFSEGVLDQYAWAGIMLPSVDRVGRYFPFSIVTRLPASANPLEVITKNQWFEAQERAALRALEGQLQLDDLVEEINSHRLDTTSAYTPAGPMPNKLGTIIQMESEEQLPQSMYSWLLDSSLRESLTSYSVWSTLGSQRVQPCLFNCRGLPQMRGIAAMMDGQWDFWGWHEPHRLKPVQQ